MPVRRATWASWNFLGASGPDGADAAVCVSYWVNHLQVYLNTGCCCCASVASYGDSGAVLPVSNCLLHPVLGSKNTRARVCVPELCGRVTFMHRLAADDEQTETMTCVNENAEPAGGCAGPVCDTEPSDAAGARQGPAAPDAQPPAGQPGVHPRPAAPPRGPGARSPNPPALHCRILKLQFLPGFVSQGWTLRVSSPSSMPTGRSSSKFHPHLCRSLRPHMHHSHRKSMQAQKSGIKRTHDPRAVLRASSKLHCVPTAAQTTSELTLL